MIDYNFSSLNDKEFEILSTDLLSEELNYRIERFKSGADQGVDGRYFVNSKEEIIIQCKHYLGSGYKKLIYKLRTEETQKVNKLKPKQYLFVTSVPLSKANKSEIKNIFKPYIKKENDIYGQEDLNDLLKKHPRIEENHYKLWLSSTTVLKRILNNAISGRSQSFLDEIKENIKFYVETSNHIKALDILKKSNVIIITGEPGIGKTTLAENLCLFYCSYKYELCLIENSLNEAEGIYSEEKKQIFYFDDFLGSNYLQALQPHEDTHITRFIKRIIRDKHKKFILTSRTNIFNQGLALSDTFKHKKIKHNEFLLSVNALSDFDKAQILYNHMWFNFLNVEYIDQIYIDKRYKKIITHPNYNPRLIEYITDSDRIENIKHADYWDYILDTLTNPSKLWTNPFYIQSDNYIRTLVLLTVFNGNTIGETSLKQSYNELKKLENFPNISNISSEFEVAIKATVRFFLNRTRTSNGQVEYSLFNPSIADFIIESYKDKTEQLCLIFQSLRTLPSLKTLSNLNKNKKITEGKYKLILISILDRIEPQSKVNIEDSNYLIILLFTILEKKYLNHTFNQKASTILKTILLNPKGINLLNEFVEILLYLLKNNAFKQINKKEIFKIFEYVDEDLNDINAAIKLIRFFKIRDKDIINDISSIAHEYLAQALYEVCCDEIEVNDYILDWEEYSPSVDDISLSEEVCGKFDVLVLELESSSIINIDRESVCYEVQPDQLVDNFISNMDEGYSRDEERYHSGSSSALIDSIDDLFDRSGN